MTMNKTLISLLILFGVTGVAAQDKRHVEVILPYAAGGGVDAMGRAFAREASQLTGQNWVVVNRDGGAGTIGFTALTRAAPDGQTLVFSPASALTNSPFLMKSMPFRLEQVEPVCQVFENVFTLAVRQESPIKTMQDLVARAKAAPGTVLSTQVKSLGLADQLVSVTYFSYASTHPRERWCRFPPWH